MTTLINDIKYGIRQLLNKPGFTVVVVITLALGIGAVTAVLSVMNGTFRRLFPYEKPGQLVLFDTRVQGLTGEDSCIVTSGELFRQWQAQAKSYTAMTAYQIRSGYHPFSGWSDDDDTMKGLIGLQVSSNFFSTLGIAPAMGRVLSPQEDCLEEHPVVVLSDHVWRRQFSSDPDILGREILMDGHSCQVIGVMPANYRCPPNGTGNTSPNRLVDYWIPLPSQFYKNNPGDWSYVVIGRLKPDVTAVQAQAEMDAIHAGMLDEFGNYWSKDHRTRVVSLSRFILGEMRSAIMALLVAAGFVLLIAAVNVSNLLTVRGMERRREMAIRCSMGCSTFRLIRQVVTENLLLALAGGIGGIVLARIGTHYLVALAPDDLPGLDLIRLDWFVLGISLAVTLLCGFVVGLIPGMRLTRVSLHNVLKESASRSTMARRERRTLQSLVSAEVALTLTLLIGATVMIRSFWNLIHVDLGLRTDNTLSVSVLGPDTMKTKELLIERFRAMPGVEQAALMSSITLSGFESDRYAVTDVSNKGTDSQDWSTANICTTSVDSFSLLGITLKQGRGFSEADHQDSQQVAIISEGLAQRLWPGENPLGRELTFEFRVDSYSAGNAVCPDRRIVGVVADVKNAGPDSSPAMTVYLPVTQSIRDYLLLNFLLRSTHDPQNLISSVRRTVAEVCPASTIMQMKTLNTRLAEYTADRRFLMTLLITFAVCAFCLAMVGLYGVVSHTVSRRTSEIAIRLALGAQRLDVQKLILKQSLQMIGGGLAAGLILTWILRNSLAAYLFGVAAMNMFAITASVLILILVAVSACYIPTHRAARIDPMEALRYE